MNCYAARFKLELERRKEGKKGYSAPGGEGGELVEWERGGMLWMMLVLVTCRARGSSSDSSVCRWEGGRDAWGGDIGLFFGMVY